MQCVADHDFPALLRNVNLRTTVQRLATLRALHNNAASADEIVIRSKGALNRVSAYRIIKQLLAAGIVVPVQHLEGATQYQLADHHKDRIICTSCGVEESLKTCLLGSVHHSVLTRSSFISVHGHAAEFFGTCNKCSRL